MKFIAALAIAPLVACATTQAPKKAGTLEMLTFPAKVQSESLHAMDIEFPFAIESNLGKELRIGKVSYELAVEGEAPTTGEAMLDGKGGDGTTKASFVATAKFASDDEAFERRAQQPVLPFTMKASVEVEHGGTVEEFEAEWNGEVYSPTLPLVQVRPQAARYEEIFDFQVILKITNPNGFPLELAGLDYTISVEDTQLLQGTIAEGVRLVPNSDMEFDMQQWVGRDEHMELARALAKAKSFSYSAELVLRTGELELPRTINETIEFPR